MQRILITGGAGFIGSHLATALIDKGCAVHILDDLSTGDLRNIQHLLEHPLFSLTVERMEDSNNLFSLVESVDIVYHLAAGVGVDRIMNSPISTIETNIEGTFLILKAANKFSKRLILASTSEVYGLSQDLPFHEESVHVLGPAAGFRWGYAGSKLLNDYLAMAYSREYGLPVTVARLFNTVGPRQTDAYGMVIPRFVTQALQGKPITVYGDGHQTRCFLHVADAVKAFILLAEIESTIGHVFNIGSTQEVRILDLARRVLFLLQNLNSDNLNTESLSYKETRKKSKSDISEPIVFLPTDSLYNGHFEDMARRLPETSKIHQHTGWVPVHGLDTILCNVIEAMRDKSSSTAKGNP